MALRRRTLLGLLAFGLLSILGNASSTKILAQSGNPALQRCKPSAGSAATAVVAGNATAEAGNGGPLLFVVTTVAPLTNIAYNIGGNRVQIHGLIPQGVHSLTFTPKPP